MTREQLHEQLRLSDALERFLLSEEGKELLACIPPSSLKIIKQTIDATSDRRNMTARSSGYNNQFDHESAICADMEMAYGPRNIP